MTELIDLDKLRRLRLAIERGECAPIEWQRWLPDDVFMDAYYELHGDDNVCHCDDRAHVLAGLDRLIVWLEAPR